MDQIRNALLQFIEREGPQAIALTGRWGRGKTYFWNSLLSELRARKVLAQQPYSYVSAFGISGLDDHSGSDSFIVRQYERAKKGWREGAPYAKHVASYASLGPLESEIAFNSVRGFLVCIDDLERHGDGLSLKDILGFVSMLREQRGCRILVIFNNDALTESDGALFAQMREKVFDYEISFEPTARDCAALVFNSQHSGFPEAIERAVELDITNIRVLTRARTIIASILSAAGDLPPALRAQVIHSAILFTWSFNAHDASVPTFEYLKRVSYGSFVKIKGISEPTDEEAAWNAVLEKYDYQNTDDLDIHIARRIEAGYGDDSVLAQIVENRKAAVQRAEVESAYRGAWDIYHKGFGDDEQALVEAFRSSVLAGAQWISANNISSTAQVLRAIGRDDVADVLVDHWVEVQAAANPKALDLSDSYFIEVKDDRTRERINAKFVALHRAPSLKDVVLKVAGRAWGEQDISVLMAVTPEDFERLFLEADPSEVRDMVIACRQFARISNADGKYDDINTSVDAALRSIGGKSLLNRLRVGVFGIELK